MIRTFLATLALLAATTAHAQSIEVNKATAADLDNVRGIGPALSGKILEERRKAPFRDWEDFMERVKGIAEINAANFSHGGLTVNGQPFRRPLKKQP